MMMRVLMLPEDEALFTSFVTGELGFEMLESELVLTDQAPVAADPLAVLPPELPNRDTAMTEVVGFNFWWRAAGPLRTIADAPPWETTKEYLWREGKERRYGDQWQHVVDPHRSPVLRLHRSIWTGERSLHAGRVEGMKSDVLLSDMPPEIVVPLQRTREWLMRPPCVRIRPPWDRARGLPKKARQSLVVWALPNAACLLAEGGGVIDLD